MCILRIGFLDKLTKISNEVCYQFFPYTKVNSIVNQWSPRHYNNERAYQNDLLKFLNNKLYTKSNKEKYVKIKRVRGDIVIGNVCIELKYNSISTGAFDRLETQIKRYKKVYSGGYNCYFLWKS